VSLTSKNNTKRQTKKKNKRKSKITKSSNQQINKSTNEKASNGNPMDMHGGYVPDNSHHTQRQIWI
jgi:hypothetical protein